MDLINIYNKLLKYFGHQGWWPIFDLKTQKCQYHKTIGYPVPNSFEICVGAILTQNTVWKNVEKALRNLSLLSRNNSEWRGNPINPEAILSTPNLKQLIQPAGYYNQKAKKLRIFAEWWLSSLKPQLMRPHQLSSNIKLFNFRKKILDLWGIGPETADSILLYAFGQPIFVIDTYTKRLCEELGIKFKTYDEYQYLFHYNLPKDAKLFNEYHALIVAWGKLYSKNKEEGRKIIGIR